MAAWVTLTEWAQQRDLSVDTVRNFWARRPEFPAPKGTRARPTGSRRGALGREYDAGELDMWLAAWEAERRPSRHAMPDGPEEYRTLGAIAGLLGLHRKTVSQYRDILDECCEFEERGARRFYRTRDVVTFLNGRLGFGQTVDPDRDRRRRGPVEG